MKNYFKIAAMVAAVMSLAGCEYDDSSLKGEISELQGRVDKLEELVQKLTSNVSALQVAVDAINNSDRITEIIPLADNSGFTVKFLIADPITIHNGVDGQDGHSPAIGVKKDESTGIYYWTLDGEPIIVDGQKIPATAEYGVPQMKIEDDKFWFSVDGEHWTECGSVASSGIGTIKGVKDEGDSVVFTLYDDSTISIPKVQKFALNIETVDFGVVAGKTKSIPYTITEPDDATVVKVCVENGYTAKVSASSTSEGTIAITAPDPLVDATLLVVAINGKGVMSGKMLSFEQGQLTFAEDVITVGAQGGEITVSVKTNVEYGTPVIDPSATSWITPVPATKAMRTDELKFSIAPYEGGTEARRGEISFMSEELGRQVFTVIQLHTAIISGGAADFETIDFEPQMLINRTGVTTAGWNYTNCFIFGPSQCSALPGEKYPALSGRTSKIGVITSPLLEGGCGSLTIGYASYKGKLQETELKFRIEVKTEDGTVKLSKEVYKQKGTFEDNVLYTEQCDGINCSGKFTIELTNLCPSSMDSSNKECVVIPSVSWTGYSE